MMESDKEIAQRFEEARERGEEFDNLVPVKARFPRNAESIYSIRLTSQEMQILAGAARAKGMKLSQFIRDASLQMAASGVTRDDNIPTEDPFERISARFDERFDKLEAALQNGRMRVAVFAELDFPSSFEASESVSTTQEETSDKPRLAPGIVATTLNRFMFTKRGKHNG